jgi:hypothetical protein
MQSVWFKDENKIEPIKKEFNYQSVRGKLSWVIIFKIGI